MKEPLHLSPRLTIESLAPGIFIVKHSFPWPANSLIVEMANSDLVMIDTPYSVDATFEVLHWIDANFGKRKILAVNTHFHNDRLGGNEALLSRSIPVFGSDLTVMLLKERGKDLRQRLMTWIKEPEIREYIRTMNLTPPGYVFELQKGVKFTFDQEEVQVEYPGPGHSPDNVVVYFPSRKLLFAGCLVNAGDKMGNTSDADLEKWADSVTNLWRYKADWVIPGHGDRYNPNVIENTLRLLKK